LTVRTVSSQREVTVQAPELVEALSADLFAERAALADLLRPLDRAGWATPTPSAPWTVRDQVAHLGIVDRLAVIAATDGDAWTAEVARAAADFPAYEAHRLIEGPDAPEVLDWWRAGSVEFDRVYAALPAGARVPWYGPAMSVTSMLTARLMETWAHGQDVVDGLGLRREPTDRLRHVCHLAFRARPYAYAMRGLPPPDTPVRVELTLPSGTPWHAGEGDELVTGTAEDFCLVLTRRRHVADTGLAATRPHAEQWLLIGQAFAGPPGGGREPGQFAGAGGSR
jgi:uncharacterized protein (TIGR03084 family)